MADASVLIAGYSGRALAEAARRAGYVPLVVDACGDLDTRAAAAGVRTLPDAFADGFHKKSLFAALDDLVAEAGCEPLGLVLASGFEDCPELVAKLADRYRLLGCGADVIRAVKSPSQFFAALDGLGIAHPETRIDPPASGEGWLTKRIGGSGGLHVARCRHHVSAHAERYFQRQVAGTPISVSGVIGASDTRLFLGRQWASPMPHRPYRYGGAVGPIELEPELADQLIPSVLRLGRRLGVSGLCSFDFIFGPDGPLLLEVNPRPGATLDIFDDAGGALFRAHINQYLEIDTPLGEAQAGSPEAKAAAILYADAGPLPVGAIDWPEWTADRPAPSTVIDRWRPVATVFASAPTADAAMGLCEQRLGALRAMIYGQKKAPAGGS